MNAHVRKTNAELALTDLFLAARQALPGGDGIAAERSAAFDRFAARGLPHSRVEAWKYTDLKRLMQDAKQLATPPDAIAKMRAKDGMSLFAGAGFRRLMMVDGTFVPELSDLDDLEPGLTIRAMVDALAGDEPLLSQRLGPVVPTDDPVLALNTAMSRDGVVVAVLPETVVKRPIQLSFVTTSRVAASMFTRSFVMVGSGAAVTLVETHEGPDRSDYQVNNALQLVVGERASVDCVKVTHEGNTALHMATLLANVGANGTFNHFGMVTAGALVRNQLFVRLAGAQTVANIRGLSLLAGNQHADTTLAIAHDAPGGQSRELFKAVVDGNARAVFQGRINVGQEAQKTDARMMTRALLLSDEAEADSKPELEIFADDVQCGHGATTGALDEQLRFYLMARGIPAKEADALLIRAFAGEVIEALANETIRDALTDAMVAWLARRG
jgi:Fe-S cluster assembly protein SufD